MQLQLSTWPEVEAYLAKSRAIILPIGSTEQHGPNGMIGTDALTSEVIAKGIGDATGALVAPTIAVGMAQHHLGFPGSMALRPSTMIAVIRDMVGSLVRHGFERFYFINGHGGNVATTTAAFSEIYAETSFKAGSNHPSITCKLKNWYEAPSLKGLSAELFPGAEGSHATPSEVSLTWFAYPDHAKPMKLSPEIAPRGSFTDANDYRRNFPDGRIGSNPGLSSVAAGKRIYDAVVKDLIAEYRDFAKAA